MHLRADGVTENEHYVGEVPLHSADVYANYKGNITCFLTRKHSTFIDRPASTTAD